MLNENLMNIAMKYPVSLDEKTHKSVRGLNRAEYSHFLSLIYACGYKAGVNAVFDREKAFRIDDDGKAGLQEVVEKIAKVKGITNAMMSDIEERLMQKYGFEKEDKSAEFDIDFHLLDEIEKGELLVVNRENQRKHFKLQLKYFMVLLNRISHLGYKDGVTDAEKNIREAITNDTSEEVVILFEELLGEIAMVKGIGEKKLNAIEKAFMV